MNKDREIPVRIIVKRARGGHGGHHGGAWKVAFADFMTAMFALFLVLWLVNQSTDIRSSVAGYFQDPLGRAGEYGSSIMPGEGAQASTVRPMEPADVVDMRRNKLAELAKRLHEAVQQTPDLKSVAKQIEIMLTDDGLRISLLEDSTGVFFETGHAEPNPRGRELLVLLGTELGLLPNPVQVEGHTDARPYSTSSTYTNWELSADRANWARRIMTEGGLKPIQIQQIRGHADRDLRVPTDPYAASNRRITITMLLEQAPAADSAVALPRSAYDGRTRAAETGDAPAPHGVVPATPVTHGGGAR